MPRPMLHIAIFTAVALAAPMIAGTADARSRNAENDNGVRAETVDRDGRHVGDRHRRDWDRRRHGHGDYVSPRRIERKVRRLGGRKLSSIERRRGKYWVRATGPRGYRVSYVFDARSGDLLSARPIRRNWRDRRHRGGWHGRTYRGGWSFRGTW